MNLKLKNNHLLSVICKWIGIQALDLSINKADDIKIVIGEAIQNIIRHGYKNNLNEEDFIEIKYERDNEKLILLLRNIS
jgi:anti-sigma regulatory factor (Ser/Thr protein kinase)